MFFLEVSYLYVKMNISPRRGPEKMFLEKVFYKLDVLGQRTMFIEKMFL
jgi:hypothetical protein